MAQPKNLPFFAKGYVIKGFGRGSKELGIPTANLPDEVIETLPSEIDTGIYYGLASVNGGTVHKMVMSIGWNPFYKNIKKSMEAHILHDFSSDFYGSMLRICILGYIRPEKSYNTLEDLIAAIKSDISFAEQELNRPEFSLFRTHSFFTENGLPSTSTFGSSL